MTKGPEINQALLKLFNALKMSYLTCVMVPLLTLPQLVRLP